MEKPEIKNTFTSRSSARVLTFRDREGKPSIELYNPETNSVSYFPAKPEDDLAMAIAVLGVERVTDEVEAKAQALAKWHNYTEEQMLEYAIAYLRAAMIIRERNSVEAKKDLEDAFALYKLCYPKSVIDLEEFSGGERWISNLRKVREDPTVLGTL